MWDIHWTDPNRQLVGEHRAQKYAQRARQDSSSASHSASNSTSGSTPTSPSAPRSNKTKKQRQQRNSFSTRSSLSSTDSPFSFFRTGFGKRDARAGFTSPGGLFSHRKSVGSEYASPKSPGAVGVSFGDEAAKGDCVLEKQGTLSPELSCQDSVFSKDIESDQGTSNSLLFEVSIEDKTPVALGTKHNSVCCTMSGALIEPEDDDSCPQRVMSEPNMLTASSQTLLPISPNIKPRPLRLPPVMPPTSFTKINNSSAWRSPREWPAPAMADSLPLKVTKLNLPPRPREQEEVINIDDLRGEIAKMDTMIPAAIMRRIRNLNSELNDSDAVSTEKQRWMLWALAMDKRGARWGNTPPAQRNESLLALYETPTRASYLAASNPSRQIHHLSPSPLPQSYCPLITPVPAPMMPSSSSPFPLPQLFNAATALILPALLPETSAPDFLSSVAASLKARGKLHLTLISPAPRAGTAGPLMGAWLEGHLFPSLRDGGICTVPTRMFPRWLGEAGLRGPGSSLTTTKFFAAPPLPVPEGGTGEDTGNEDCDDDMLVKARIRSAAGRLLWLEVWGRWIVDDAGGWWDDARVIEECLELGTIWEYQVIEAVKNG